MEKIGHMVRLTVIRPEKPPEFIIYDKPAEVIVGRSSRCTIALDFDPMVSRMHAAFLIDPPKIRIKDLDSTNGLRINGEFYGPDSQYQAYSPLELCDGDEVVIGGTRFRIELAADGAAANGQPSARGDQHPRMATLHSAMPRRPQVAGVGNADETVSGMGGMLPHIPGYRLMRFLSEATVGKVYLGVPNGKERSVAVKVMFPPSGLSPEVLKFFFKEFDAARNVVHPNLARMFGAGELAKGGGVFIASEYVGGDDLSQYAGKRVDGRLPSGEAVGIAVQIASAACRLHKQGMAHLDLKPASVIVRDEGRVVAKVTDAGFSSFLEMTGLQPPVYAGRRLEKLGFLAPEQLVHGGKAGAAADVFSLCALLFFMIAGRSPYKFGEGDPRAVVESGAMWDVDEMVEGKRVPELVADIMRRGLQVDPAARFADACELLAAFENLLS